jgi:hypothetical protein
MDIQQRYDDIVQRLQKGIRVLDKLQSEEVAFLKNALAENKDNEEELKKLLCITENTRTFAGNLEPELVALLNNHNLSTDVLIYTLNASRKHSIAAKMKEGNRLSSDFLMALVKLLSHQDPEVVEWTLRVIDETGPQQVFFYKTIKEIKPSFSWIFNKHKRNIVQLVDMFHKRWMKHES